MAETMTNAYDDIGHRFGQNGSAALRGGWLADYRPTRPPLSTHKAAT